MIGRVVRTLSRLHPIQVAARAPSALVAPLIRDVPEWLPPAPVERWPASLDALRQLATAERARGAARLTSLPPGALRDYEACYGLELGADDDVEARKWRSCVAVQPYPASVRARRIAVATRLGRRGLQHELARAARAILVRPELHLLGNHLLENAFGLVCAGAASIGREADLWWAVGRRLLDWQLQEQFLGDGGHIECSASYHLALTAGLLESIELADASGRGAPEQWRRVASRALGWIRRVQTPDGAYPLFNDAALDAAPSVPDVLSMGRALGVAETADSLAETGWLRSDCGPACLVIDAGPDALGWQPGHAHADGLTFELWLGRNRVAVDYGVATYEPGAARDRTRSTAVHNTVEIGGQNSCETWGAFRVGRRGEGHVRFRRPTDGGGEEIGLEHDGYASQPGSPRHRRTMTLESGTLGIRDEVIGGAPGTAWVSRLRLDASSARKVRIGSTSSPRETSDVWFPNHGSERPAVVLEQVQRIGDGHDVNWRLEWRAAEVG
jgi:uncharacterized heparinase superfamily protein